MNIELLKKYAKLAVEMGINLQENDTLCINSPIETAEFARFIAEAAYAVGAKDVIVNYNDAKKLYEYFNLELEKQDVKVENGIFGADMKVNLLNDGPVTIIIDSEDIL